MDIHIPDHERVRFENLLEHEAGKYQLRAADYLRKVWYHQQAPIIGEYVAAVLVDRLLVLGNPLDTPREEIEELETTI